MTASKTGRRFYTSDLHLGHERVLDARPFSSVEEMDDAIAANWNAVVEDEDEVFVLGDFSAYRDGRLNESWWRLRGQKHLIIGNHDEEHDRILELPWVSVDKFATVQDEGRPFFLCHYPMSAWPKSHKGVPHLFGHVHGRMPAEPDRLDVGVDCWDFRPTTADDILRRMRAAPKARRVGGPSRS